MSNSRRLWTATLTGVFLTWPAGATAVADESATPIPEAWMDGLEWRSVGPANMGGRITDLAVYEADPCIWWAATASGGLLKTVNDGVTFEHQFDGEATVSIGAVAVAPSDPAVVWVGTGESNARNSVSWGDGVYKSTDGGATWKNMGLRESFQIGRIAIHPENPDVVYVGALGRLWGANEERGLYKTSDGGESWERVLYLDDMTGVIDVQMHPEDPDTLLVATWERLRDGFSTNHPVKKWGPGSAIYRTTDGGDSFDRLTDGLPTCNLGRIGLSYFRSDPNVAYAIIETERIGKEPENAPYAGLRGEDAEVGARLTEVVEDGPAAAAGLNKDDIVIRVEDTVVHSYADLLARIRRHLADDTVEFEVSRDRKSVVVEVTFAKRPGEEEDAEEAESAPRRRQRSSGPFGAGLGGQRQNAQDQQGPDGHEFGGVFRTVDGGETWERINSINPRPMYFSQIRVDPSDDDHLYVLGISLHRSKDGGETFTSDGGRGVHPDHHAMWIDPDDGRHIILGCDGGIYVTRDRMDRWDHLNHVAIGQFYHVTVGPRPNYRIYGGLQDNGSWGGPGRARNGSGPINEDWFRVGGGDGFVCRVDREDPDQLYFESQNGGIGRINLRTGDRGFLRPRAPRGTRYRFNWKTPFILSNHNSRIYYAAGNHVFRSLDRGTGLKAISPEITNTDRGSATALAESALDEGVLYVGTDDGALWMTKDGGHAWVNLFDPPAEESEPEPEAGPRDRADADRAGPPTGERRRRGGGRMLERLKQADANEDGKIERDELPERMAGLFDRLDANDDDVIDAEEMAAARRARGPRGETPPEAAAAAPAETPQETPEKAETTAPAETKETKEIAETAETAETGESKPEATADAADPITGSWEGRLIREGAPADQGGFKLLLRLADDGTVSGRLESRFNEGDIVPGTFDHETGRLVFEFEGEQMGFSFAVRVKDDRMTGDADIGGGMFSMELEAKRTSTTPPETARAEAEPEASYDWTPIAELLPEPRWISSIEASRHEAGRVYLTVDGHRSDDDTPYLFVSENHGRTWRSLRADLPDTVGSVRVLREDVTNPSILYLGTEFSAWVSADRGASWTSLNTNLPTVAVHEFAQHPTGNEIVAATHGRSVWILDVAPLRQVSKAMQTADAQLLTPSDAHYWRSEPSRGGSLRRFVGQNPPSGAAIYYTLPDRADAVTLKVMGRNGRALRELEASGDPGLHRVVWDLRREPPRTGRRRRFGPRVEPGVYTIVLEVGDRELTSEIHVKGDPEYPDAVLWGEAYDEMMSQFDEGDQEGPAPTPLPLGGAGGG